VYRKVFVTGANGFIGRALARRYRALGAEVCGIDLHADPAWGVAAADMLEPAAWRGVLAGSDLLIHTAALVSNTAPMDAAWRVNVLGTRRVLAEAAAAGVQRFVHLSSVAAFGFDHAEEVDETVPLRTIGHPYVDTKITSEHTVMMAHLAGEVPVTIVRPGDVYGPASRPWVVLPLAMMKAGRFLLPARGRGVFSPVYIDDLVDGIALAADHDRGAGQVFILTGTEHPACAEYFVHLARMLGRDSVPAVPTPLANLLADAIGGVERLLGRPSEVGRNTMAMLCRRAGYSIARAQRLLGYAPRVRLAEGMARVEVWCRENGIV
jgi:nucleoside-diphosphate-sugar epimerase